MNGSTNTQSTETVWRKYRQAKRQRDKHISKLNECLWKWRIVKVLIVSLAVISTLIWWTKMFLLFSPSNVPIDIVAGEKKRLLRATIYDLKKMKRQYLHLNHIKQIQDYRLPTACIVLSISTVQLGLTSHAVNVVCVNFID